MSQALATITMHSSFIPLMAVQQSSHGQGYAMPAKRLETAADVLANSRAVYLRMRAPAAPVPRLAPPADGSNDVAPNASTEPLVALTERYYGCPLNMLSEPSWRFLVALAAVKGGVKSRDIIGPERFKEIAAARHYAVYLIAAHTALSLPAIGRVIGGRDHSTVNNSLKKFPKLQRPMTGKFLPKNVRRMRAADASKAGSAA
ncbi:helix-turn-helix domain-containing protein [Devosia beringensis]|uniref:helix-turn-helix domain-containing protein n=1 Tax=Devosia beringensis TaxID=2657486 RepID=UPI00186B5AE0|nr:helix-turn-helix domain-containing protein [Devosia beringensis]